MFSCFAGIGAFEKALDNLKIPYELVGYSEIDKYASKSYSAIHNVPESMNLGDITKIDEKALPKDIDLITYGFPCQDISLAGKQKGLFNEDGTQTRSGLFFDSLRIIKETQPRVAIAENVKNLVGKKFSEQFKIVLESLEEAGYNNYWKVLNAKDFGIPQNRERVFIVSIRKDIDTGCFQFPEGFPLELRLKDMLEDVVDEKWYLNTDRADVLVEKLKTQEINHKPEGVDVVGDLWADNGHGSMAGRVYNTEGQCPTLGASHFQQIKFILDNTKKVVQCGNVNPSGRGQNGQVVDSEGLARTITIEKGEGQKILVREAIKHNYGTVTAVAMRGRYNEDGQVEQSIEVSDREYANAITTVQKDSMVAEPINTMPDGTCRTLKNQYFKTSAANFGRTSTFGATGVTDGLRIRKLTPKECFRLMGFDDADFEKAENVNSNTQLYKQAGNSIVVDVLEYLIKALADCGALATRKEQKEMELRVNDYQLPSPITFNYEEIKKELIEKVSMYETLVYTDEQIKDAKNDRASLNKLKKALNDERIRLEKEYMQPFNDTKAKFNEIIALIDKPVGVIDTQVKAYEEKQKEEKLQKIEEYIKEVATQIPGGINIPIDCKWLNASVSMKSVQGEIDAKVEQIKNDLATLQNIPEFGFEATEVYKTTLDINRALNEGKRLSEIAKAKAVHEAEMKAKAEEEKPEPTPQPIQEEVPAELPMWVAFQACLTVAQAKELAKFFKDRNIEFKPV